MTWSINLGLNLKLCICFLRGQGKVSADIDWSPSDGIKRAQTQVERTHIGVSRNVYLEQFIFHVIQTAE